MSSSSAHSLNIIMDSVLTFILLMIGFVSLWLFNPHGSDQTDEEKKPHWWMKILPTLKKTLRLGLKVALLDLQIGAWYCVILIHMSGSSVIDLPNGLNNQGVRYLAIIPTLFGALWLGGFKSRNVLLRVVYISMFLTMHVIGVTSFTILVMRHPM